jgi:hypothetical protein
MPNTTEKMTAATKDGLYAYMALHASGGTLPFFPGTAGTQDAVALELVVMLADIADMGCYIECQARSRCE